MNSADENGWIVLDQDAAGEGIVQTLLEINCRMKII